MSIHMTRRIHVSAGRKSIMLTQQSTPAAGVQGTKGVLKLRGALGCVRRTTMTPKQTNEKAKSVPMLVISPATLAGTTPASSPITVINSRLLRAGVWKRLSRCEKSGGSKPSRLML